jgi:hypothetical protein
MSNKRKRRPVSSLTVSNIGTVKISDEVPLPAEFVFNWERDNRIETRSSNEILSAVQNGMVDVNVDNDSYQHIIENNTTFIISPRRCGKTMSIVKSVVHSGEKILVVSKHRRTMRYFNDMVLDHVRKNGFAPCFYLEDFLSNIDRGSYANELLSLPRENIPTCVMFDDCSPHEVRRDVICVMNRMFTSRNETGTLSFIYLKTP